jgi:hypothetical protein
VTDVDPSGARTEARDPSGISTRPSRYGHGPSYVTGGREIAHFHGETRLDVRLTRAEIRRRKVDRALDPRIHLRHASGDWAEVSVETPKDLAFALELVEEALRTNS